MQRTLHLSMLLVFAAVAAGCLINTHREDVVGRNTPRVSVAFESDQGMMQFVETVERRYPTARDQGTSSFGIPFVIASSSRRVLSENAFFNTQVEKADLNRDGVISDAEAAAYAR